MYFLNYYKNKSCRSLRFIDLFLHIRETAGDKVLIGVERGVDLGVDPADRSPAGLVNLWLSIFSFPSGTEAY